MEEEDKQKKTKKVPKEIQMDVHWMTCGDWENTEMVAGIGLHHQNH